MEIDPNIDARQWKGEEGMLACAHYLGHRGVTRRGCKYAIMRREIVPTRLGNSNWFSTRDVMEWVESRRVPGRYVAATVPCRD